MNTRILFFVGAAVVGYFAAGMLAGTQPFTAAFNVGAKAAQ